MTGIKIFLCLALLAVAVDANGNPARRKNQIKTDDIRTLGQEVANDPRSQSLRS